MRAVSALTLLTLAACGSEYGFGPAATPAPAVPGTPEVAEALAPPPAAQAPTAKPGPVLVDVPVHTGPTGATEAREDPVRRVREEVFVYGDDATTPVADYLFVVDNSSSMARIIEQVRAGFASLSGEDVFPSKARVAVMSTMPGAPDNLRRPHPASRHSPALRRDAGFLRLVDQSGLEQFVAATSPAVAERFTTPGCAEAWFAPDAKNAAGVPCIVAHTQTARTGVRVEAGLVAVKQVLEGATGPVFRPGAAANIVFVSDTHDPGVRASDDEHVQHLLEVRPDWAELQELVDANSTVSSLRIHAVAPRSECVEPWGDGATYFDVVDASGGMGIDICTASDYTPLIRAVAREGAVVRRPVFPLGRVAADVGSVHVDDAPVSFALGERGDVLLLDGVVPDKRSRVRIQYRYEPGQPALEPARLRVRARPDRPVPPNRGTPAPIAAPTR